MEFCEVAFFQQTVGGLLRKGNLSEIFSPPPPMSLEKYWLSSIVSQLLHKINKPKAHYLVLTVPKLMPVGSLQARHEYIRPQLLFSHCFQEWRQNITILARSHTGQIIHKFNHLLKLLIWMAITISCGNELHSLMKPCVNNYFILFILKLPKFIGWP